MLAKKRFLKDTFYILHFQRGKKQQQQKLMAENQLFKP